MEKRSYGGILICMVVRIVLGALVGIAMGISAANPVMGGAGVGTMIAGFLCIPVAALFFLRKPYFPISFFAMVVVNIIGGIVLASNPFMKLAAMFLPVQTIMFVLVIIMDALFVVFLIRSVRVAEVFGTNLFRGGVLPNTANKAVVGPKKEANMAYQAPVQNYSKARPEFDGQKSVQKEPVQQHNAYAPQQNSADDFYKEKYEQAQREIEQMRRSGQNVQQQNTQYNQQKPRPKTGIIIAICSAAAAVAIVIVLVMNLQMSGFMSMANTAGGLFSQLANGGEEGKSIREYIAEEMTDEVRDTIVERLNESGYEYRFYFGTVSSYGNDMVLMLEVDVPDRILESDERLSELAKEIARDDKLNKARKKLSDILSGDAGQKTGKNVRVHFEFYAPDGTRLAVVS